jgi:adenine-specific DNA-methyltransferase
MHKIKQAIAKFSNNGSLVDATKDFFSALNIPYQVISSADYNASDFFEKTDKYNDAINKINTIALIDDKALNNEYEDIDAETLRKSDKYDALGVFAVELKDSNPTRTTLVEITRAINREMEAFPVAVIFRYGNSIAIASTERTDYKSSNRSGEKVGKVSIIRDIDSLNTHPGHLQILNELSIDRTGKKAIKTFDGLYKYWYSVFNVSLLNKKFYQELSNWYFWALREVKFPNPPNQFELGLDDDKFDEALKEHNGKNVIRLLTRILFVWFIKEKGLIPEEIFDEKVIADRFIDGFTPEKPESSFATGKHTSKYYRAIIQNLFFATLNQSCGLRKFKDKTDSRYHNVTQYMRYKEYIKDPEYFIQLMEEKVPFMNGGLFECLDKPHPTLKGKQGGEIIIYVDGFSDREDNVVEVPDYLFFDKEEELDLSNDYGDKKKKKEITRGLITILKNYKFTITENTPIEEEVALDPELLGKVFENLLASYNPETKSSARKQTGSFYTPREIVNYMVEESLIAYLKNKLNYNEAGVLPLGSNQIQLLGNEHTTGQLQIEEKINQSNYFEKEDELEIKLHELVSFSSINPFENDTKTKSDIIKALDECTILDPACGSGAYPMGILQKMVHILHKIDPKNEEWKQRQLEKVKIELIDCKSENKIKELNDQEEEIRKAFEENELDYARKLYLIENCIYGVDIQPIATQISKLRFFISLVVEQKVDASKVNFGIRPLPNLETKFVAANTLIGLDKGSNLFDLPEIKEIEKKLKKVRHDLFAVKEKKKKIEKRKLDKELREQIATKLEENGFGTDIAKKLASWDPFDQNTSSDFFDKEWMFDKTDGFDIVIGNPPYLNLSKSNASEFINKFETAVNQIDLYGLFIELSIYLANTNGIISLIVPDSLIGRTNFKELRNYILKNTQILSLTHFSGAFESAAVDSVIINLSKIINANKPVLMHSAVDVDKWKNSEIHSYSRLTSDIIDTPNQRWIFNSNEEVFLARDLFNSNNPVSKVFPILFRGEEIGKKSLLIENFESNHNMLRVLFGESISKYDVKTTSKGININNIKKNLNHYKSTKVSIRQVGNSLNCAIDKSGSVTIQSVYNLVNDINHLINFTLLYNSKLYDFLYNVMFKEKLGFPRIVIENINELPYKEIENKNLLKILYQMITFNIAFSDFVDAVVFNLYFPDHMKERDIDVLEFVEKDLAEAIQGREFEKLSDTEKEQVIEQLQAKWTHLDNEVVKRMGMFKEMSPEILKLILEN